MFISDIRACQNKEQETRRVDKELAKIRGKFGDEKKTLTGGRACWVGLVYCSVPLAFLAC